VSRLWRSEERVGLCPDRLVLASSIRPVEHDPAAELRELPGDSKLAVVLSNHFVRYAVLPWSAALASEQKWLAYARHTFTSTYGSAAAGWQIRVCATGRRQPCLATAVDASLIESLSANPRVVSIEPYLIASFNARARAFGERTAWFVLQEPGRLTLSLFAGGAWKLVRVRQAARGWRDSLADVLDRELAACGEPDCDHAFAYSEEALPERLGRYRVADVTLPRGASPDARPRAMALG
jgi:hypothetical protein